MVSDPFFSGINTSPGCGSGLGWIFTASVVISNAGRWRILDTNTPPPRTRASIWSTGTTGHILRQWIYDGHELLLWCVKSTAGRATLIAHYFFLWAFVIHAKVTLSKHSRQLITPVCDIAPVHQLHPELVTQLWPTFIEYLNQIFALNYANMHIANTTNDVTNGIWVPYHIFGSSGAQGVILFVCLSGTKFY